MRVLVCGGRGFYDWRLLEKTLGELEITDVIHGAASGADMLAHQWAYYNNVRMHPYPANWEKEGKLAGVQRNYRMLVEGKPDVVIAFQGGKGTANMVNQAKKAGVTVKEIV